VGGLRVAIGVSSATPSNSLCPGERFYPRVNSLSPSPGVHPTRVEQVFAPPIDLVGRIAGVVERDDAPKGGPKLLTGGCVFVVQRRGLHASALSYVPDRQFVAEPQPANRRA
jgi:hypothetical protein